MTLELWSQMIAGAMGALATITVAVITYLGVQRITAKADARNKDANATQALQEVIKSMGGVYDELVANVRESAEAQIRLEYKSKIEVLETRLGELEADKRALDEERREWEMGIARLIAQIVRRGDVPEWRPKEKHISGPLPPIPSIRPPHGFRT
jgi:hypothetical protein